jgi:acyl-[acyl-carrier-protein]-phospholipid O-acyltransferase/long-chain-fatty-acid--[acyl-carrier-protein] ligase
MTPTPAQSLRPMTLPFGIPAVLTPVLRLTARLLFRHRVHGADRIPPTGPVLLAANRVGRWDRLLLRAASPRPLWFAEPAEAAELLKAGHAVVVFPEGEPTRNGQLRPFGPDLEPLLGRCPVVPAFLDNLWNRRPFDGQSVAVQFGEPMPPAATTAEVRAAVVEAGAECAIRESEYLTPLPQALVRTATRWRNLRKVAFIDHSTGTERTLTWPRALVGAWCLSRWLRGRVGASPVVGVWLPTGLGSALANYALAFLGKTTANLNYTAGPGPVAAAAKAADLKYVVTAKRFLGRAPLTLPDSVERLYLEDAFAAIGGREKLVTLLAVLLLPAWLIDRLLGLTRVRWDDPLTVIFSSGSTGDPKGVTLSHRNITANVDGFVRGIDLRRDDRFLATLPFFHSFGYTICLWAPCRVELSSVFFPDPRQAKEVGELCRRYGCTLMLGTATFLRFYLRRCGPEDFQSLRLLVCGAEKLPVSLTTEFAAKCGVQPVEGYGCTETSPVVSVNLPDGPGQRATVLGTVGQPIPGVAVRAFDPDTFAALPTGLDGVLGVKGPNVMLGYLHQPERTKQAIRDGWYLTGDVGRIEPDGFIRITGRLTRFAKIAGEMVPVERVEDELHELLHAGGDRFLAVAAVPDDRRGEKLVVLHLPQVRGRLAEAFDGLRGRGLPNLWVPDVRDCHEVDGFPVLGTGKLDLRGLDLLARERAGVS